jgi:hypothetical protein
VALPGRPAGDPAQQGHRDRPHHPGGHRRAAGHGPGRGGAGSPRSWSRRCPPGAPVGGVGGGVGDAGPRTLAPPPCRRGVQQHLDPPGRGVPGCTRSSASPTSPGSRLPARCQHPATIPGATTIPGAWVGLPSSWAPSRRRSGSCSTGRPWLAPRNARVDPAGPGRFGAAPHAVRWLGFEQRLQVVEMGGVAALGELRQQRFQQLEDRS